MDVRILIQEMLFEISQEEDALEEKRKVVKFLEARVQDAAPSLLPAQGVNTYMRRRRLFPDQPAPVAAKRTLRQTVAELLREFGDREFVVGDVHEELVKKNMDLPVDPRSKITTILSRMLEAGELERTFVGGGNVPHKYKVAASGTNIEAADEDELSNEL